ncbi:gliding motility lipoprotein GldH [Maribellus maritimus]|uniref:gliding motility lipoprotein GldH n=1 Tax=Maribellus maritimus TaxID=2870838 RepID=UPI001EE9B23E|nr:gliding motility lipoprotein GldH [Maribellus maritimus]MCG6188734.1 gliding motility lipoprotein GldH [Maribellus maritimus]
MKKIKHLFFLFGLLLFILSACDKNKVFEEYKTIPEKVWNQDSLVHFSFPVTDTLQHHNLYLNIRNEVSYSYSNLWLFIEIVQPDGKSVKDTFEVTLADPSGKWLGEGFSGLKTLQAVYRRNVYFPVSGEYKINIQQGMREENLEGISDIGFRVEKIQ